MAQRNKLVLENPATDIKLSCRYHWWNGIESLLYSQYWCF